MMGFAIDELRVVAVEDCLIGAVLVEACEERKSVARDFGRTGRRGIRRACLRRCGALAAPRLSRTATSASSAMAALASFMASAGRSSSMQARPQ